MKFHRKLFIDKFTIFYALLGFVLVSHIHAKQIRKRELVSGDIYINPDKVKHSGRLNLRNLVFRKHEEAVTEQIRSRGSARKWKRTVAVGDEGSLWDDGIIPYELSSNLSERLAKTIYTAIKRWESVTCLKFVPAEEEHEYSILFENQGDCGCCSYVGKEHWQQEIVLEEDGCNAINIVLHEIGHAIGFHHEQNRPDRDKFIKVMYEHIEEDYADQYDKLSEEEINTLGYGYDFDSIMHYASDFFSKGGETMVAINNTEISLRQRRHTLSKSDIAITNKLYKCPVCLFNIKDKMGTINFTSDTSNGKYCEWYFKRNEGEVIEFVIDNVNIPENENCTKDYLDVLDGYSFSSPYIDYFCGNMTPEKYYRSTSNHVLILFEISNNTKYAEFSFKYKVACGREIKDDEGTIESPQSPDDFPYSSECEWIISVPENHTVALHFQSFNLGNNSTDCNTSYVEVWDGSGNDSTLLDTFCGSEVPQDILSSDDTLTVKYVTDMWREGIGFKAFFTKETDECELDDSGGCSDVCVNTIGSYECLCEEGRHLFPNHLQCEEYSNECGGVLNVTNRTIIASPSFPNTYPRNIDCTWEILNENIAISFLSLDVEKKMSTCVDKVEISGFNITSAIFCGNVIPGPINFTDVTDLKIEFKSDLLVQRNGFAILLEPME